LYARDFKENEANVLHVIGCVEAMMRRQPETESHAIARTDQTAQPPPHGVVQLFRLGYSRCAFRQINRFARERWKGICAAAASGRGGAGKEPQSTLTSPSWDSSTCECFAQERPAKAGCGKSARPV
jgi:hypothetical protein